MENAHPATDSLYPATLSAYAFATRYSRPKLGHELSRNKKQNTLRNDDLVKRTLGVSISPLRETSSPNPPISLLISDCSVDVNETSMLNQLN